MTYRILKSGHIELKEGNHRRVIQPNEPIPKKYRAEIESDENFALYRTAENATAYEQSLIPEPKTKDKLKSETLDEVEKIALKELLEERIKADPYLTAMLNVESKIDSGEINENARKAIRDEIKRTAK